RTGEQHAQRRPPHVRGGLPLVEHGLRRRRRLRALRDHPLAHAGRARAPAAPAGGAMRRTVQAVALHGVLAVGAALTLLPLFLMLRALGVIDTYWGVIVPGMASVFGIFLVRQYALAIPDSVLDAARVDGAGEFRIYRSLVFFLCAPVLVTLAVFTFMGTWNDFMWPLIVLADDR